MIESLSAAQARRIFLASQDLSRSRPRRTAREQDFAAYLERQGVLQLDSVNVLARAHYMPLFSRLGPYRTDALDTYLWGDAAGHSPHVFEHWGHEASVMPMSLLPAMHQRMTAPVSWQARKRERLEAAHPGIIDAVRAAVEADGPVVARDLEHLAPRLQPRGDWWDQGAVKETLEYLFITGKLAASRGRHFARTYDGPMRAWGVAPADTEAGAEWGLGAAEGQQALFDRALAACGVSTPRDLTDHFRLPFQAGPKGAGAKVWAESAVERGLATWVSVEGWKEPALLASGATDPGRVTARALLSPFDPVCWYRPRLERMFGVDYRIEIYTPAAKRQYGYYCLLLLVGDQIGARLDLKADRRIGQLSVEAAWREPGRAPGARRLSDASVAAAAASELALVASWLGLESLNVLDRGDLSARLRAEVTDSPGGTPSAAIV